MKICFDSSAYAKRFIEESGSQQIDNICQRASEIGLAIICYPEIISALNRRLREDSINKREYKLAKHQLSEELSDIEIINITPEVVALSVSLLENNAMRAMDALHIACAMEWNAGLFVTCDRKQEQAAKNVKLHTEFCK